MIRDKDKDSQFSYDALTDLANEHGDQAVIDNMIRWLESKMGSTWTIINKDNYDNG